MSLASARTHHCTSIATHFCTSVEGTSSISFEYKAQGTSCRGRIPNPEAESTTAEDPCLVPGPLTTAEVLPNMMDTGQYHKVSGATRTEDRVKLATVPLVSLVPQGGYSEQHFVRLWTSPHTDLRHTQTDKPKPRLASMSIHMYPPRPLRVPGPCSHGHDQWNAPVP